MPRLHFEDFIPGSTASLGRTAVSKDDIVAFAREWDPQPFHLDEEAAKATLVGELIASGWHSCSLLMRMIANGFILDAASMGAPGVDEVKWLAPVRPGDTLAARYTVLETRTSRSRPDMGLVRFRFEVLNQLDRIVVSQTNWIMIGRRETAAAPPPSREAAPAPIANDRWPVPGGAADPPARAARSGEENHRTVSSAMFLDDLAIGDVMELGAHAFAADDIIRFARAYDPQSFHVDPEAARRSHFGALCASGWHTAAAWMRQMATHRQRSRDAAIARGERPANLGPSPGFRDLKWLKPVYVGDVVSYRSTVIDKRPSASRTGWGLVFHHNTGDNQRGERVFEFRGCVFWERAP